MRHLYLDSIGLNGLKYIEGNCIIITNSIYNLKGLERLISIGGDFELSYINFWGNLNFNELRALTTVGGNFKIRNGNYTNDDVAASLEGLKNLSAIGGNLNIEHFNGISLEGLENLQTIKELTITYCKQLNNIHALGNIKTLDEISITDCPALYDFCILKNLVQNMSGTFYVNGNGYNPTKYQLLNGACSQTPPDNTDDNNN